MAEAMADDFQLLFTTNPGSFQIISDSCMSVNTVMISDTVETMLKKFGIGYCVYFIKRSIERKGVKETWIITNPHGSGQPCWPFLEIRRSKTGTGLIEFLSVRRGICEI